MLYHTENLESFFRRLSFSPDGSFLFTPSGIFKNSVGSEDQKEEIVNTVYIYSRSGLNKPPIAHLPGLARPALAIAFSPIFYELDDDASKAPIFQLPYKMVYAIATQDTVIVYDTQHEAPLGTVSNIHYRTLTDLTFNSDGNSIVVGAADGFCSVISFEDNALGMKLSVDYRTLLPASKENTKNERKMQSPAQVKKRSNTGVTEITGLVKKKVKSEGPSTKRDEPTKRTTPVMIITPKSPDEPQAIQTPHLKQVKRLAPTPVENISSRLDESK